MLHLLLLSLLLVPQDAKAGAKTVEDRLKELDEKVAALEKKHKTLSDENAAMEKQIADAKAMRANLAAQVAAGWVQRYAAALKFDEKQTARLKEIWTQWTAQDFEKPAAVGIWKEREDALRKELSAEQIPLLARKVREEQETGVKATVSFLIRPAKLDAEKTAAFEKAVLGRIDFEEGVLIPQAHAEKADAWTRIPDAAEAVLPQFSSSFTEAETSAIRKGLERWRPRQR
jgi:septal ring factor EnvC (AmiA/AmiB activator)